MRVRPFFWCLLAGVCISVLIFAAILDSGSEDEHAATIQSGGSPATAGNCATGTAYALALTFKEMCVDVAKGGHLQIVPAAQAFHLLDTRSWVNGKQVPMNEPGAPTINHVQLTTRPVSIGPFNVAGTFHIDCSVHPNMNLTIVVR